MRKSKSIDVKWGDIYYCNLGTSNGSVQTKTRPVLVIQNNIGNQNGPTTVVAAISSVVKKMYLPTHIMLDCTTGLREKSVVMLEQVRTVDKATDLKEYVGKVRDKQTILAIKRGLSIEMGLIEGPHSRRKRT